KADQDRLFGRHPNDGPSLMGVAGLMRLLGKRFGDLSFSDLKIPFACSAVDYKSGREIVLHDGCVLDAVIASSAMPGIFPPRTIGDLELVDGGMLDPVPVEIVRWLEPRLPIVAVVLSPPQEQWARVPSFQVPRNRSIPSLIADQFSHLRLARALQIFIDSTDISLRMLTELRLKSDAPDLVIRPDVCQWPLLAKIDPGELVQTGSDAAAAQMPRIKKLGSWTYGLFGRRRIPFVPRLS
ncbi:MAG TPA: patatin-like phospholipase family protein, partial [Anaerolineaceae bacterium]